MRNAFFIGLIWLLTSSQASSRPLHVVIDPGHGGHDRGAFYNGIKESRLVLSIARSLRNLLNQDRRFKVTLTRQSDQSVTLNRRTRIAEQSGGDVFLSIHANAEPSSKAHGAEFFFKNELPPDEESLFLAKQENASLNGFIGGKQLNNDVQNIVADLKRTHDAFLSQELTQAMRSAWRDYLSKNGTSARQAPFHVLSEVAMPSMLIETGYLSNPSEAAWLAKSSTQAEIARILHKGLIRFKERLDKTSRRKL